MQVLGNRRIAVNLPIRRREQRWRLREAIKHAVRGALLAQLVISQQLIPRTLGHQLACSGKWQFNLV